MDTKLKDRKSTLSKFVAAAKTNSGKIHVIPANSGWSVKREGTSRAFRTFKTKEQALQGARTHKSYAGVIVIHEKDGSIQKLT